MKTEKFAYVVFITLVIAVISNSVILGRTIDKFIAEVSEAEEENMDTAYSDYQEIYDNYKKHELYISITTNHGDLENIESAFAEIIGAAKAGDRDGVITQKSRLIDFFAHIKRLSGINIDSIF